MHVFRDVLEGGRRPIKLFFRLGGRAHPRATEKIKIVTKIICSFFLL